jgi:hypothetical protein
VALLTGDGMTPPLAIAASLGRSCWACARCGYRHQAAPEEVRPSARPACSWPAPAPADACVRRRLVGAGKPGEFGRFLLLTDVFLAIEAVVAVATFTLAGPPAQRDPRLVLLITALGGGALAVRFVADSGPRLPAALAEDLRRLSANGSHRLAVTADPAPYGLPPVDLFRWQIVRLPRGSEARADREAAFGSSRPPTSPTSRGGASWNGCDGFSRRG